MLPYKERVRKDARKASTFPKYNRNWFEGKEWVFLLSVAAPPLLPQTFLASQNLPRQWPKIPFNHDLSSGAEILQEQEGGGLA